MTGSGPTSQPPPSPSAVSPAMQRAARMSAANMVRSLAPLVLLCLVIVGFTALRQQPEERVQTVDPASTVHLAAARAGYAVQAPTGLDRRYLSTSARTNAGKASPGQPVTLEIGYLTPARKYAGFVESDDPLAQPVRDVLSGATQHGSVDIAGVPWTRSTTKRGETALSRTAGAVTLVVTGSAGEPELTAVAAALRPYSG
jgi:hypothetical protein